MLPVFKINLPIPFPLKSVNCYYIPGSLPTLIDCGINTPLARRVLQTSLQKLGGGVEQIRRIIVTHGHLDHAGMAGWIARGNNAEIFMTSMDYPKLTIAQEDDTKHLQKRYADFLEKAGLDLELSTKIIRRLLVRRRAYVHRLTQVNYIKDQDEFDFNGVRLKVVATPGHTPGAICLFDHLDGRLFSGDTLLKYITPNPVVELDNPSINGDYLSLKYYTSSLSRLEKLKVKTVLPGHGNEFRSHYQRIDQIKVHIRKRKKQVVKILEKLQNKNGALLVRIATRLFPMLQKNQVFLALSETVAYLSCLKEEGHVNAHIRGNRVFYRLTGESSTDATRSDILNF